MLPQFFPPHHTDPIQDHYRHRTFWLRFPGYFLPALWPMLTERTTYSQLVMDFINLSKYWTCTVCQEQYAYNLFILPITLWYCLLCRTLWLLLTDAHINHEPMATSVTPFWLWPCLDLTASILNLSGFHGKTTFGISFPWSHFVQFKRYNWCHLNQSRGFKRGITPSISPCHKAEY